MKSVFIYYPFNEKSVDYAASIVKDIYDKYFKDWALLNPVTEFDFESSKAKNLSTMIQMVASADKVYLCDGWYENKYGLAVKRFCDFSGIEIEYEYNTIESLDFETICITDSSNGHMYVSDIIDQLTKIDASYMFGASYADDEEVYVGIDHGSRTVRFSNNAIRFDIEADIEDSFTREIPKEEIENLKRYSVDDIASNDIKRFIGRIELRNHSPISVVFYDNRMDESVLNGYDKILLDVAGYDPWTVVKLSKKPIVDEYESVFNYLGTIVISESDANHILDELGYCYLDDEGFKWHNICEVK